MSARKIADGIEFVFKWFGLILMVAAMVAIVATEPPAMPSPVSPPVGVATER